MRKFFVSIIAIVGILVGTFLAAYFIIRLKEAPPRRDAVPPSVMVRTETVDRRDVTEWIHGFGQVEARHECELAPEVSGRVAWVDPRLRVGEAFIEGADLVRIDASEFEQAVRRAEGLLAASRAELEEIAISERLRKKLLDEVTAELKLATQELDRLENLSGVSAPSLSEIDRQRMQVRAQRRIHLQQELELELLGPRRATLEERINAQIADVDRAKLDLARTTLKAPFSAHVRAVSVEVGEYVQIGAPLAELVSLDPLEAHIRVPASQSESLRLGALATVAQEARETVVLTGPVVRVAPDIDAGTRTIGCYVALESNGEGTLLRPGTFVVAKIPGRSFERVVAIPRDAFVDDKVYVAVDGRARVTRPIVKQFLSDLAIVEGGIEEGSRVILTNLEALYDGYRVAFEGPPLNPTER